MIDFQSSGLSHQVYKLITRMCDLACSDEFPNFVTKQLDDDKWKCELTIPGVSKVAYGYDETEVGSINKCANLMIYYLDKNHDKNQYDPNYEDSIFLGNIEQFFGDVEYDKEYKYHLCESDILIDNDDEHIKGLLKNYAAPIIRKLNRDDEEIDQMSQIVTIRFLVKKKKSHYC